MSMKFIIKLATFLVVSLLFLYKAHAGSPTSNVGSTKVDKGVLYLDSRFGFTLAEDSGSNDSRLRLRQHVDYGFTDWYAFRILTAQDKRRGDNLEHSSFTLENRFQFIERSKHGWDGGVRLLYSHSDGDKTPHELDFRLMAQVPFGRDKKWEYRHNTIFEHDIGPDSRHGIILELRQKISKSVTPPPYLKSLRFGIEMFNDFGRLRDTQGFNSQDHQIGPLLKASFKNGVYLQTGYRTAFSDDGTDHVIKLFLGRKF